MMDSIDGLRSSPRRVRGVSRAAFAGIATTCIVALTSPAALAGEKSGDHEEKATAKVTVVKKVAPAETTGEDVTGAQPAAGWTFTGTSRTSGVGGLPATHVTDAEGAVTFDLTFPVGSASIDLTVAETQQAGFELVTRGGANAVCKDDYGAPVAVVNDDSVPGRPGFRLQVDKRKKIKCVVFNRPAKAEVTVAKQWVINGQTFADGRQPAGFDAALTLTGPGAAGPTPQPFGVTRSGYLAGESVTLAETIALADATCTVDAQRVTMANGASVDAALPFSALLVKGSNTFTVTNRITCPPPRPPVTPPVTPPTTPPVTPPATTPPPQQGVLGVRRQARPRLGIEKHARPTTVTAGDTVRFTIVVRNTGNAAALRFRICDRLPRDVTVVDRNGGTLVSGGRVCWRIRRLRAGASVRRVLVVRVDRDARPGTLVNRATVGRRRAVARVRVRQPGPPPSVGGEQVTG